MNPVARPVNIALPDPLEAIQNIDSTSAHPPQLIGKPRCRIPPNPFDLAETPLLGRPFRPGKKQRWIARRSDSRPKTFQVSLRAATGRKSAPDKSYGKIVSEAGLAAMGRHGNFTWLGMPQYLLADGG